MKIRILTVDEMDLTSLELTAILKNYQVSISNVKNEYEALDFLQKDNADTHLIVWAINSTDDLDFSGIKKVRNKAVHKHIPILVISKFIDKQYIIKAIEAGASQYIVKPYQDTIFLEKFCKLLELPFEINQGLQMENDIATYSFEEMFNKEFKAATRGGYPLSLVLLTVVPREHIVEEDQNELKKIIETLNKVVKARIRETDAVFQHRGSYVLVLLPFSDTNGVEAFYQKINHVYDTHSMLKQKNDDYKLLSISVVFPDEGRVKDKLLEKLEEKLAAYLKQNNIHGK